MDQASMKNISLLVFLVALMIAGSGEVNAASECGITRPETEALKFTPSASAARDEKASVSSSCCALVKDVGQNPACLCAVMLSNTVKTSVVKLEVAITIPKRCNHVDRPVGYKCGAYTLP